MDMFKRTALALGVTEEEVRHWHEVHRALACYIVLPGIVLCQEVLQKKGRKLDFRTSMVVHFMVVRFELLCADDTRLLSFELFRNYNEDLIVWAGLPAAEVRPLAAVALPQQKWTEKKVARAILDMINQLAPSN